MRPGEHGVVDRPLLGGHRLTVDDAEHPDPPAVEVGGGVGWHRGSRCRGRFLLEHAGVGRVPVRRRDRCALHGEAVLAYPPDVDAQRQHESDGKHGDVQCVEPQQRRLPDLLPADEEVLQRPAEPGDVVDEIGPDGDRPVAQLVPREQVAGEGQAEREHQQHHTDDPVELPRLLVRAGEERPHQMEDHDEHHQVGRPPVHVADELTEPDAGLELLHVAVRGADRGRVEEHQVDAGDDQDPEEHRGDEAEAERVADPQHPRRDLHRVQVQEEVGERLQGATARRVERRVTEHRPPEVAALDPARRRLRRGRRRPSVRARRVARPALAFRARWRLDVSHEPTPWRGPSKAHRAGSG